MNGKMDPLNTGQTGMNLENSLGDLPTMRMDNDSIGRVDRYELTAKLGEGGFGAVYGARDTEANILVALKALPSEVSCDAEEMDSIRDNFSLVSRLHHPGIASLLHLHKVGVADLSAQSALGVKTGDYLVVMEYAAGTTLYAYRRAFPGQKIPVEKSLEICGKVAEALDYAHSQRVLHRDIKSKNIMISHGEIEASGNRQEAIGGSTNAHSLMPNACTVKVLDFGLAAEIRSSMSRKSKDPAAGKSGTPLYMAPEQWAGRRQDGRADQYALAAVFYELVAGEVPFKSAFDSGNFEIMRSVVLSDPVEPLKELDKKQNAVLLQALSKDPENRFASCGEFIAALGNGKISKPRKNQNGGRRFAVAVSIAALILIGGGAWFFMQPKAGKTTRSIAVENAETGRPVSAQTEISLTLADAVPLKTKAEIALDKVRRYPDEWSGYATEIERLDIELKNGAAFYEQKEYRLAVERFNGVIHGVAALQVLDGQRQEAQRNREKANLAREGAENADAKTRANELFTTGGRSFASAQTAFDAGKFEEASAAWKAASQEFERAQTLAVAMSGYLAAKDKWENRSPDNGDQITDNQLRQFASVEFAEAQKFSLLGAGLPDDPALGKKHYETALANYIAAVEKTKPFLIPQLKLTIEPADVEAVLRTASGEAVQRADAENFALKKSETYTLTVSKKGYKTHTETLTADWNGEQEKRVELKKMGDLALLQQILQTGTVDFPKGSKVDEKTMKLYDLQLQETAENLKAGFQEEIDKNPSIREHMEKSLQDTLKSQYAVRDTVQSVDLRVYGEPGMVLKFDQQNDVNGRMLSTTSDSLMWIFPDGADTERMFSEISQLMEQDGASEVRVNQWYDSLNHSVDVAPEVRRKDVMHDDYYFKTFTMGLSYVKGKYLSVAVSKTEQRWIK